MKRSVFFLTLLAFTLALAAPALAKTWNLRMTSNVMNTHPVVVNGFQPWIDDIAKATNDQVKIRYYNPNTICHEGDIASSTMSGIIDIGTSNLNRNVNEFPLHDVFTLPMLADTATQEGVLGWRVYTEFASLQNEVKGMKILGYWGGGVLCVGTVKKPILTLADFKGMRIIAINKAVADIVTALGANPIIVPFPDVYMALARNQADGILFSKLAAPSIKLQEYIKNVTEIGLESDLRFFGINWNVWNSFPADVQKAIESLTGDEAFTRRITKAMDDGDAVGRGILEQAGAKFYALPEAEQNLWINKLVPLNDEWKQRMVDGGFSTAEEADKLLIRTLEISRELRAQK